ncbi:MAG: hypothetical protein R3208_20925, partial [Ketobacteraceae bacterium]|nr:hypothetical protein [Ketobacteraceae bacterium]
GYNTNINSATSSATTSDLRLFNVPLQLLESNQKTDSAFIDTKATLNISRPVTERRVQYLTLSYQDVTNDVTGDFNIDIFNIGVGYLARIGESQVRFPLGYQAVAINNEFTQSFLSLGFDSITPIDRQNDWINFGVLGAKRFKNDHLRDTDLLMLGSGWGHVLGDWPAKVVGSVFLGEDHARKQKSQGYTFGGVRGALEYRLNLDHTLYVNALYQEARYHARGVFVEKRQDRVTEGVLGWRWKLSKKASVTGELSHTDNESSLTLFTYDRFKSQLGFVYLFD